MCLISDYSLITNLYIFVYELAELTSISVDRTKVKPLYQITLSMVMLRHCLGKVYVRSGSENINYTTNLFGLANAIKNYLRLKICVVCVENFKCLLIDFVTPNLSQIFLYSRNQK